MVPLQAAAVFRQKQMPAMQGLPVGRGVGDPLGLLLGDPLGLGLGEPDGGRLGLVLGELDGDLLGDAFVLRPGARGLVVRGTAPVLVPVRLGALADPEPGAGRAAGFVALADDELTGGGSFDDAVRNAPVTSRTTSTSPVSRAVPTASAVPRRRFRCARASSGKMPVPSARVMCAGITHSAGMNPMSWGTGSTGSHGSEPGRSSAVAWPGAGPPASAPA